MLPFDGSGEFSDYREQLVTWDEYAQMVPVYAEQVSLPADAATFCCLVEKLAGIHFPLDGPVLPG